MTRKLSLYSTCTGYIEFHWWEYPCKLSLDNPILLYCISILLPKKFIYTSEACSAERTLVINCVAGVGNFGELCWRRLRCASCHIKFSRMNVYQLLIRNLGEKNYIHVKISFCEIKLMYSISQSKRDNMLFEANCLP